MDYPKTVRIDTQLQFDWSYSNPAGTGITHYIDWFARWTGFIKSPYTGWHSIRAAGETNVEIYIDGQLHHRSGHYYSTGVLSPVYFFANRYYHFQINLLHTNTHQRMQLYWRRPNGHAEWMPASVLFHNPHDACPCPTGFNSSHPAIPQECGGVERGYCARGTCVCKRQYHGDACELDVCVRDKCFGSDECAAPYPGRGSIHGECGGHG